MVDHIRENRRVTLLAVGFAIVVFSAVSGISTAAARPAQEGSPVTYITNNLGIEFAPIPVGQFPMGCSDGVKPVECSPEEKPKHTVQITKPFEFGKTEVTQKQWQAAMGSNPSQRKGDDLPVETITFEDVQAFLAKLNARNDGYR